jgi:hypothetical protein
VGLLTEPPPSTGVEDVCKEKEKSVTPHAVDKLPLQRTPKRGLTPSPQFTPSPRFKDSARPRRLPPRCAPDNLRRANAAKAEAANAEAGPSRVVVTRTPQVVAGLNLLALPPIPRDVFDELTSMFDDPDSSRKEPEMSDEEAKARKFGWDGK